MATPADATANRLAQMVASVDRQPRMPMTPDEYSNWRRQLWDQRGPNVKTPTYNELLPCYKAALERCRQQVGEVTAPPRAHPMTPPAPASRQRLVDAMVAGVVAGAEEPFYVVDLDAAKERLALWRSLLPGVEPHYAVKCNGDAALILTLAAEGVGFDCASASEIKAALALGVPPSRILYANPVKQPSHVRYAAEAGVPLTVFDGEAELHKMARLAPSTSSCSASRSTTRRRSASCRTSTARRPPTPSGS